MGDKQKDFEVVVLDDQDHEHLVADIEYKGMYVCLLNQERGFAPEDIEVEFPHELVVNPIKRMPLDALLGCLEAAKKRLLNLGVPEPVDRQEDD